jgi:hypothetical protein
VICLAVEGDLSCALLHAGHIEHGLQRHAAPARVAHGAIAQLTAGDPWIEKSAAVARALIDRDQFDRGQLADVLQGEAERTIDLALDRQREFVRIDGVGDAGQMIAHEKSIIRCDRAVVEHGEWRLELRRPAGQADHRAFLRIFYQRPFAVVEGWGRGRTPWPGPNLSQAPRCRRV